MKLKIITTLTVLCWGTILLSQIPFPENDAVWKEIHVTFAGEMPQYYSLCGDTIIDNNNYTKIQNLQIDSAFNVVGEIYSGAIRTEGEVVYLKPNYESDEYVLFDFSLEAGDVIDLFQLYATQAIARTVDSTNVQMLAGKMRKVIYFTPGFAGAPVEFWIEGIGSSYGWLGRAFDPGADVGFDLECFEHGDDYLLLSLIECFLPEVEPCQIINSTDDIYSEINFSIFPNPAADFVRINFSDEKYNLLNIELLNIDGRTVKSITTKNTQEILIDINDQPSGVYFLKIWDGLNGETFGVSKLIISRK